MTRCVLRCLLVVPALLLAGCATQSHERPAIATPPSVDELPELHYVEPRLNTTVIVENPENRPRVPLVPDFKEPELTPEERAALGEDDLHYEFVKYPLPWEPAGSRVGTWYGGVRTDTGGLGRPSTALDNPPRISGTAGKGGPVALGDPTAKRVSGVRPVGSPNIGGIGPEAGVTTASDRLDKRISAKKTRRER